MRPPPSRRALFAGTVAALLPVPSLAQAPRPFEAWLAETRAAAAGTGLSPRALAALDGLTPNMKVIELDRRQSGKPGSFQRYRDNAVAASRITQGQRLIARHGTVLARVEAAYQVPARVIVALWGIETSYGANTGNFSVIRSLATLAWEGRRAELFRAELLAALAILDQGHISAPAMIGSWAGAMGQCQFMPTSFLKHAQDFDGDGRQDIWGTLPDVFASTANYLHKVGWNPDYIWGRAARLPPGFDLEAAGLEVWRPLETWAALGVTRTDGGPLPAEPILAAVLAPDGVAGPAFVVYENFKVFRDWNRSTNFALSVGLLSDRVGGG